MRDAVLCKFFQGRQNFIFLIAVKKWLHIYEVCSILSKTE